MNEQISKYWRPIVEFWKKLSKKVKIAIIVGLSLIVVISIVVAVTLNTEKYVILYGGLSQTESAEVITALQERGAVYRVENAGTTIMVNEEDEELLRMQLAVAGYPNSMPDYSFYDNSVNFMTTDSQMSTYEIFQREVRLQATIAQLEGVSQAIVTIVPAEEDGYIWEQNKREASVSVLVTLNSGQSLSAAQVNGIKRLVETGVAGVDPTNIAVIDNATGLELSSAADELTSVDIANFKLTIEKELQQTIEDNIIRILQPLFGTTNAVAVAKCSFDVNTKVKEIIEYTPSTDDDMGMLSSSATEKEQIYNVSGTNGVVGTEDNADLSYYVGVDDDGNTLYFKDNQYYEYLVNKTVEQITIDSPELLDVTIAVSVNRKHTELLDQEKYELQEAVANAAGVAVSKVTIYNGNFDLPIATIGPETLLENDLFLLAMAGAAIFILIIIILILMAIRKVKRRKEEEALAAIAAEEEEERLLQVASEVMQFDSDLKHMPETKQQALKKEITDFAGENPEIVAQLVRTWLRGGEEDE